MSIHRLVKYLFTVLILVSYIGLVLFSISSNKEIQKKNSYWDWYRNYVSQSSKGTFVNTGTQADPVALSESQGYGMLITLLAAQKGYTKEDQFMRLFHYYKANRISEQNTLMKWQQKKSPKPLVKNQSNSFSAPILYATKGDKNFSNLYASQRWIFNYAIVGKDYYGDTLKVLVLLKLY